MSHADRHNFFTTPLSFGLLLFFIGGLLGATLNYFQFGFSSSFRTLLNEGHTAGMRAIIWMLGGAIVLFAPLLAIQSLGDQDFYGLIRPLSLSVPIGAFIFGIGMQIGCGCTSGTLNRVGQKQVIALPTLGFMVIGGLLAAWSFEDWRHLPTLAPFAFQEIFGWGLGLAVQLSLLFVLYRVLLSIESRQNGSVEPLMILPSSTNRFTPLLKAGLLLAFLNALLLLVSGSPWSISAVFPFWGIQIIELLSLPVEWPFWDYSMENQTRLDMSVLTHPVSLTTFGVIMGAFVVTLFHPRDPLPIGKRQLVASVVGGLIMGFGAVLASGCNIGAFFSGIASGSLHGWVWFLFALFGNIVGLKLRRHFLL